MNNSGMVFCRCCGKQIHETAPACPQCGGLQGAGVTAAKKTGAGTIWVPIAALVFSIVGTLALFDDKALDRDTSIGIAIFAMIGIVFGTVSIRNQADGKKMAIAAIILSALSLLALIGMHSN